ncbi:MAG: beta-propeller domain-containing protein [Archaeoglobaceae archaeon]|nr:beta-propeller domain-containing protein [Archaeoglobaceae archaeon]MCX8000401.1 beta-propeller domain-containing protein [Leptospiraceae bacterium]MDW7989910.1 beta-propeller domain-containing protein [Archaeoglobaceae archaeon]
MEGFNIQESFLATSLASFPTSLEIDRFSGTNVQVFGIDEPDIVKNNGKMIFISKSEVSDFLFMKKFIGWTG